MGHMYEHVNDDETETRECGDEGVLCPEHLQEEEAYWLAELGGPEGIERRLEEKRAARELADEGGLGL